MSTPGFAEMDQMEKDAQTDIRLLVECVKCQLDNPDALKKSLVALATLFSIHENGKVFFRKAGGIKFLVELLTTSKHREVKGAVLYVMACAVEKNVFSQREMSSDSTFTYLKDLVAAPYSEMKLIKSALYLIMCLVANNSHGQMMVRQSGCLQGLLHLFRKSMPSTEDYTFSSSVSESSSFKNKNDEHYKDLWTSVTSALCICVNNPQNEENQRCCATIFPYIFKRLKNISDLKVIRPILSLVSLAVGNNVHNQERVVCSDGIHSLMSCLFKVADKAKNNPTYLALAGQIAGALGSCIADNALNAKLVGKQGGVKIFLQLLDIKPIDIETKEHIIVTLGFCVDTCEENRKLFAEENGFAVLAQHLVNEEQEDFNKAVKFVLKTCVSADQKKLNATSGKASDLFNALIKPCIQFDDLDGNAEQRKMIPCSGLEIEVEKLAQNQKLLEQKLEAVSCVQASETAVEKQLPSFTPNKEIAVMETEDKRLLKESGAGYYSKNLQYEKKEKMKWKKMRKTLALTHHLTKLRCLYRNPSGNLILNKKKALTLLKIAVYTKNNLQNVMVRRKP
ncbi:telomere repeats-binding bouquet formation protein 1 isoform X6 [Lingula anatina]|uniref:Telomere repeats-binding bouquet formation protein 1 isoform X6 n=1 Tax=Lingula anatina TaxID=7574 RepID=A0A2R2MN07_LINAN|nr:telomere repeats-binding bouquet formation protein 1 isoform X6 [Lingula anatina]|eukprot:XP_023931585.1 telomere repeats-binding bouquet formation protein 1 isoform X6 [Lingula anatina]